MKVEIDYSRYLGLLEDSERLTYLEAMGVDNWSAYGCGCDITGEDECVFCTEKEMEEFLNVDIPRSNNV